MFTSETLLFLRALKRNNDREWFKARRQDYERHVREPMVAAIDQLAIDLKKIAPELVVSPKASLYRIYRDTRFSADKSPLKTHVAAVFPWRGLNRHEGAGLYFEVSASGTWMGGGMYSPQPVQLARVRQHMADTWPKVAKLVRRPSFVRHAGALEGAQLTRTPRGFPATHPAAEYLRYRQFLAGREYPADFAISPRFYSTLVATFRAVVPLVRFLNEPLTSGRAAPDLVPTSIAGPDVRTAR